MTKQVKISKNVHEQLLCLKRKSEAKSISDVIHSLIIIGQEQYLTGTIKAEDKKILLKYNNGKLVELKVKKG